MAHQNILIREWSAPETAAAVAVTLEAYQEYASLLPARAWEIYRQNIIETLSDRANGDHIAAKVDGQIVGSVLLLSPTRAHGGGVGSPPAEAPEVRLLAVAPSARGHGIGRRLMEECIRRAREQAYASLTLHTLDMMAAAMQMYQRMGFVRAPELDFNPTGNALLKGYRLPLR